jgi:hypothetical protein
MVGNACRKCAAHKDRDAVGSCAFCGQGFCSVCRSMVEGRAACSACTEKWLSIPHGEVKSDFVGGPIVRKSHDTASRSAAVVLLLLCSITYIPMLAHWDKGLSTFIALLLLAIVSFGFQAALIVRNNLWVWWVCFVLWIIDMIVTNIVYFHSLDPSGALSLVVLVFFFPLVMGAMVWINYRNETLVFASVAVGFVLSIIIYALLHVAFMGY